MGFKRSEKRMREIEVKLREGMARNGIVGKTADAIVLSITSFALYASRVARGVFALIATRAPTCASTTRGFTCALLNNQPMASTTDDAGEGRERTGCGCCGGRERSGWNCGLEGGGCGWACGM